MSGKKFERRRWLTTYAPLVIWIGVILFLGSGQGSMSRTSLVIRPILEFLFPAAPEETLQFYHGIIRKGAHFTEYAVLAFLAIRAFLSSGFGSLRSVMAMAAGISVAVAATDEFNQSFNPERTAAVFDVVLDVSGAVTAIVLYSLLRRRWAKVDSSPDNHPST